MKLTDFQLDTSGVVLDNPNHQYQSGDEPLLGVRWTDLDGHTQGFTAAVCRSAEATLGGFTASGVRFSDLAAETMETIKRVCTDNPPGFDPERSDFDQGCDLWAEHSRLGRAAYIGYAGRIFLRSLAGEG